MKALGTTRKDIYKLFTFESILIGTLGSTTGVLIGFLLGKMLNYSILGLAKATGNQPVEIFYIPFYMMALILGTSLLISLLTGFYPARRAAKISPLDALRYE
jgi:putative ABC transport system permease protein